MLVLVGCWPVNSQEATIVQKVWCYSVELRTRNRQSSAKTGCLFLAAGVAGGAQSFHVGHDMAERKADEALGCPDGSKDGPSATKAGLAG